MNFLHTISLSLLVAVTSLTVQAQFSVGPKIGFGPTYATTKYPTLSGEKTRTDYTGTVGQIGLTSTYAFNKNLSLAADLTLTQLVAHPKGDYIVKVSFPYQDRYPRYLTLPVKIQGSLPLGSEQKFGLFGNLGFYLGYMTNNPVTTYIQRNDNGQVTYDELREGRKVDLGWNAGLGASYAIKGGILQASINYQRSAMDYLEEEEDYYSIPGNDITYYFSQATFQLAYLFQFGGTGVATYQVK